ncbi:MAG: substrate-binding domain-containing protein [Clostridia bacterium]|nr:substrate-binding domain-containing protein [Clostridia bacterium]
MKKVAVIPVVLLAALCTMTGCKKEEVEKVIAPLVADEQTTESTEEAQEEKDPIIPEIDTSVEIQTGARVAVVSKSTSGEFWNLVRQGMEQAIADVNQAYGFEKDDQVTMTFEGASDEKDVESQVNTLDAVIAENPDVLCVSASDMDSLQAQLEAAKENGIPVVAFDSGVSDSKMIRAFRGTDNTRVGEIAAYRLASAIGKMGKVVVFSAQEKTQSVQERVEGFTDYIANYPDIEVVDIIYQDQVDDMVAAMQEVLDKNPQLDGVFCTNADISDLYLDMAKDETKDPIVMVGVDGTAKQQEAIRNNKEVGVVSQQPYAMGYQTIWTALMATAPKKSVEITRNVRIDPAWIDASTIDDPAYSAYLYAN